MKNRESEISEEIAEHLLVSTYEEASALYSLLNKVTHEAVNAWKQGDSRVSRDVIYSLYILKGACFMKKTQLRPRRLI